MESRFYYLSKYDMQHMAGCCGGNMLLATAHWSAQKVQSKITFSVSAMEVNRLTK
jgi:iron-sulfur cluster repair protein YtfE (RIC family)